MFSHQHQILSPPIDERRTRDQALLLDAERELKKAIAQTEASMRNYESALAAIAALRAGSEIELPTTFPSVKPIDSTCCCDEHDPERLRDWSEPLMLRPRPIVDAPMVQTLTAREIEVLGLLAGGMSNKGIAQQLFLSVRTVERHVANIYRKIGAGNKADATAYALRNHLA